MKFRDVSSSDEACPDWMLSEFWQVFGLSLLTCVLRDLLQELSGYSRCLTKFIFGYPRRGCFARDVVSKRALSVAQLKASSTIIVQTQSVRLPSRSESRDAAMN